MDYIDDVSGGVSSYDSRIFYKDFDPVESPYINYLSNNDKNVTLYTLLHVDNSTKRPVWQSGSASVSAAYESDNVVDYSYYYNYLLAENYSYIVMSGEFDSRDGAITQHIWMKQLLNVTTDFWDK